MRTVDRRAGLTIIELLVTMAVLGIGLGLLASILVGANRANRVNYQRVVALETSQLVTQVLQYHVRLAGYVGFNPAERVSSLCGASFEVPAARDSITVRYVEDRSFGGSEATNNRQCFDDRITRVTFAADGNGFLTQNGAEIVDGVTSFRVVEVVTSEGTALTVFPLTEQQLESAAGVVLRISFQDGTVSDIPVPFMNRQRLFLGTEQED